MAPTLTGIGLKAYDGARPAVLEQADHVLLARLGADAADEDSPLQNLLAMIDLARRFAVDGNLEVAATALGYCETFASQL
ncbi:hypothetical protein [Streptomyces longhuiensis]|uniref:hypothetical protein n=1 Tax=Streptomyces TaxID=1883 RepID=UPI001D0BC01D|nr:hypothetical protein [Streptomyces longhuiensis]UDM04718.1 hypothetical protein LGI35_44055 [Streptomyces longhuiensis]